MTQTCIDTVGGRSSGSSSQAETGGSFATAPLVGRGCLVRSHRRSSREFRTDAFAYLCVVTRGCGGLDSNRYDLGSVTATEINHSLSFFGVEECSESGNCTLSYDRC